MKRIFTALALLWITACVSSGTETARTAGNGPSSRLITINGLSGQMIGVHDYYPVSLRLRGVSGLVSMHYSVSATGVPVRIEITKANEPAFGIAAVGFLSDWRFKVPTNWTSDGGPQRRFKMRVKFLVNDVAPAEKWDPNDPLFTITGTR